MLKKIHYSYCPVCKSDNLQNVLSVKDYMVSKEIFDIIECKTCTLRFTQDVPNEAGINAYYKSADYISHTDTNKGLVNQLYKIVRNKTIDHKVALIKKYTGKNTGRLLDIGCGTGAFLNAIQAKGWQVAGLEPDEAAREMGKNLYNIPTLPPDALFQQPLQHYDAITMWHVLEHVHLVHEYIAQMKRIIQPAGAIFIAVPNYTSKDAEVYQQYWAGYDVPRHLYHFSPDAMAVLIKKHGLQITDLLPMWYDSFYVSLLSSKYKFGKTKFMSAGLHGLSSNLQARKNISECSSIIYVVKTI